MPEQGMKKIREKRRETVLQKITAENLNQRQN
jgi:hypothetical protein